MSIDFSIQYSTAIVIVILLLVSFVGIYAIGAWSGFNRGIKTANVDFNSKMLIHSPNRLLIGRDCKQSELDSWEWECRVLDSYGNGGGANGND